MSAPLTTDAVTTELLLKYDRPGPRYTSYPTALEFGDAFTREDYRVRLAQAAELTAEPLSLYIHLPFCYGRCTFCGCNVIITRKREVSRTYLSYVAREVRLLAGALGDRRRVVHYHWGGGTPTYQTPAEMRELHGVVHEHFEFTDDAEVAVEVDPRVTTDEHLEVMRELGFNRLSMGVQDFSTEVQEAINRGQTLTETEALFRRGRELGYQSINIDLVYGLPRQTEERFSYTLDEVIRLRPDRVACYSFAHIPWIRGNQRRILPEDLPPPEAKLALFGAAIRRFLDAGYDMIGMDHFALPEDELARAAAERRLHRNFMGYTVKPAADMLGLGVSSIGDLRGAYAQNTKKLSAYYRSLDAGEFPIEKGVALDADDLLRRDVITRLMCNFHLDKAGVESRHGIVFDEVFESELEALREPESHGFLRLSPDAIDVVGAGRLFIRNICMIFDVYSTRRLGGRPAFSRTV